MSYQSKLYEEHGLKPGRRVIRLSATRDGMPWTRLYLYSTGASFSEDDVKWLPDFKREYVEWDGKEAVSVYAGD